MKNRKDIQIRDPFILKAEGIYYLYGSTDKDIWSRVPGTGFDVYKSLDLEKFEGPIPAFRPRENFYGVDNFWAPEVYAYNGQYYMFASFRNASDMRGTAILKGASPEGPFEPWSDGFVTPAEWMCLDGTFYQDEEGTPWMVFCHEWVQIGDGTICAVRLSKDLKEAVGEVVTLFKSTDVFWSKRVYSPSNNIHGYVTDGCNLYKMNDGTLLMLWSCMAENGYSITYARSDSGKVTGPWVQATKPLFDQDGGHGMIFESYEGETFLAIHQPNDTPNERATFILLEETDRGLSVKDL